MAKQYLPLIVTDTVLDASVPLSSVFALPQLNIPIRGKIKIILMFSFYVLLDLINFDKVLHQC
jgi:hypothetical protein